MRTRKTRRLCDGVGTLIRPLAGEGCPSCGREPTSDELEKAKRYPTAWRPVQAHYVPTVVTTLGATDGDA